MRLFFLILFLSSFLFLPSLVGAQEATESSPPTPTVQSNYSLPYPGMLPDNPLYTLKMIRDGVVRFLITDSYKKAQFNLLQADKRLQAGVFLLKKGQTKTELALSTIAKGENYFSQALMETVRSNAEGRDIGPLLGDLEQSVQKHRQVVSNLKTTLPQEKEQIEYLLAQISSYEQRITRLIKR